MASVDASARALRRCCAVDPRGGHQVTILPIGSLLFGEGDLGAAGHRTDSAAVADLEHLVDDGRWHQEGSVAEISSSRSAMSSALASPGFRQPMAQSDETRAYRPAHAE